MTRKTLAVATFLLMVITTGCVRRATSSTSDIVPSGIVPRGVVPGMLVGTFADDYGSMYQISRTEWRQDIKTLYRIIEWHADSQFVIAQNAPTNSSDANKWTRIDWMALPGIAPYTWGYCLSAYDAPTRLAALDTHLAQRASPHTGCNGFPFSRMKPTATSRTTHSTFREDAQ